MLSLNNLKEANNEPCVSNSESSLFSASSSYNRQKPLSKTELVEKYKHIILRSVEFIFAHSMSNNTNIKKLQFFFITLQINVNILQAINLVMKSLLRSLLHVIYLQFFCIILLVLFKIQENKDNILGWQFMELLEIL